MTHGFAVSWVSFWNEIHSVVSLEASRWCKEEMSPYWEVGLKCTYCIELLSHPHSLCCGITQLVYHPVTHFFLHHLSENWVKRIECTQRVACEWTTDYHCCEDDVLGSDLPGLALMKECSSSWDSHACKKCLVSWKPFYSEANSHMNNINSHIFKLGHLPRPRSSENRKKRRNKVVVENERKHPRSSAL